MPQEKEIKKYRRKVSDDKTAFMAGIMLAHIMDYLNGDKDCYEVKIALIKGMQTALETVAETVEGKKTTYALCGDGRVGVAIGEKQLGSYEQFNKEWEEIL